MILSIACAESAQNSAQGKRSSSREVAETLEMVMGLEMTGYFCSIVLDETRAGQGKVW